MIEGVHIWRAALDDPGWPPAAELPAPERKRAAAFLHEGAARRWAASRWALRRVLAEYIGEAAASVELEIGERGKPRLPAGAGPEFSLSHSGGLALVAVCDRPLGIDVEAIRPRRNLVALAARALGADEAAAVRAASPAERPAVFHAAWVRREARLKCLGTGLGATPATTPVRVEDLDVAPGYAAALAVAGTRPAGLPCHSLEAGC